MFLGTGESCGTGMDLRQKKRPSVPSNLSSGFREGRKNRDGASKAKNYKRVRYYYLNNYSFLLLTI